MRTIKFSLQAIALFTFMNIFVTNIYGQTHDDNKKTSKAEAVENMVKEHNFVFVAQSASPLRGGLRQLTSSYDLQVAKDSIIADLPYFGRAYSAPIDPADGGIRFVSTSFTYDEKPKRKGGWEITIKPAGQNNTRQLLLSITENGYASLQVTSDNRQPISFSGFIKERKQL